VERVQEREGCRMRRRWRRRLRRRRRSNLKWR